MKKTIPDTSVLKCGAPRGSILEHGEEEAKFLRGHVSTPFGYVIAYAQRGSLPHYRLTFIWDGYQYDRFGHEYFGAYMLARMAAKFAREVAET